MGKALKNAKKLNGWLSPSEYGMIGDGNPHPLSERFATLAAAQAVYSFATVLTDQIDWAAIQACANDAIAANVAMYHDDDKEAVVNRTVTMVGWCNQYGQGKVVMTDATMPLFEVTINTTNVFYPQVIGPTFSGPQTSNAASTCFRFLGDNVAFFNHGRFEFTVIGFGSWVKDEKTPRVTSFGLEAMLNWNTWNVTVNNVGVAGYWGTQGSGTGNEFNINGYTLNAGAPHLKYEGTGCVVGDIICGGHWGCRANGGVGVEVGADTAYRAQINLAKVQFDANCDIPLKLSATGSAEYTNVAMGSNNYGGGTDLGGSLQPLSHSVIQDRHASEWSAGVSITTNSTGALTTDAFRVTFSTNGSAIVRVKATGNVGGVGSCNSDYVFSVTCDAANVSASLIESTRSIAGQLAWSFTNLGSRQGKFTVSYTPSAGSTAISTGFHSPQYSKMKCERMVIN